MQNSSGLFPHFLGILSKSPVPGADPNEDIPHPFRESAPKLRRPSTAQKTASDWNAPGGGYDKHIQGDSEREQSFPPGSKVNNPALPPTEGAKEPPNPLKARRKLF